MNQPPSWYTTTQYLRYKIPKLSQTAETLIARIMAGSLDWQLNGREVRVLLADIADIDVILLGLETTIQREELLQLDPGYQKPFPWPRVDDPQQVRSREELSQEAKHLESQHLQIKTWVTRQESLEKQRRRLAEQQQARHPQPELPLFYQQPRQDQQQVQQLLLAPEIVLQNQLQPQQRRISPITQLLVDCGALPPPGDDNNSSEKGGNATAKNEER
ncbi:hypothetical protein QBC36DRAFT_305239 [Triangularia setosa]|uniref:Uncharacterized protein n=1 Tax=Triangularia setosa TaxID=2587417 RepID=A0AAN6VY55_9PEZI|nr:hypothetical protein QBC36DRAFT_305239 [Podospora setosa]